MIKHLLLFTSLALVACQRVEQPDPNKYLTVNNYPFIINGDTLAVSEWQWQQARLGDYPFSVSGDIACFNNAVEFYPQGVEDIGQPLNTLAQRLAERDHLTPTAPNAIKPNSDLTNAIYIGLTLCEFNRTHSPIQPL